MIKTHHYAFPRHAGSHALAEALTQAGFSFRRQGSSVCQRIYYDSFDWRLHRAGWLLVIDQAGERQRLMLRSAEDGLDLVSMDVSDAPRFASELPGGLVRERIAPLLEERRLLPIADIRSRCERFDLLDDEAKIVARLSVGRHRVEGGGTDHKTRLRDRVELVPMRGFAAALKALRELFEQTLSWERLDHCLFEEALGAVGRHPSDYSAKPEITLDPQMPVGGAARLILAGLLDLMEANEDGVRQDLDTGFLHDLRVAVRRTRSLLDQMSDLLAAPHFDHYRDEFAWLGGATGAVRDLDVLLLRLPEYTAWIGREYKEDLEPLRAAVRSQRGYERQRLLELLASARYRGIKKSWRQLLDDDGDRWARGHAAQPLLPAIKAVINHRYNKVLDQGAALAADSPEDEFHRLRRQCKKLRYLIDAFASLFPAAEIKPVLKTLKDLQNNLGEFQDLSVHATKLREYIEALPPNGERGERTRRALAMLLERMDVRKRALHTEFNHVYAGFAGHINQKRLSLLFGGAEEGGEA